MEEYAGGKRTIGGVSDPERPGRRPEYGGCPVVVAFGTDHAGLPLREPVLEAIRAAGHEVLDFGTDSPEPVDYPDIAEKVASAILQGRARRGVLLCGSGVGVTVVANKFPGIRACLCHDSYTARQGVEHDCMNVLCLGGRVIGPALARDLVRVFLAAEFDGLERHRRRLEKIAALEEKLRGGQ